MINLCSRFQCNTDLNLQRDNSSQAAGREESADVWLECATEGQVHSRGHGVLASHDAAGLLLHGEGQALPTQQRGNVSRPSVKVKTIILYSKCVHK